MKKQNSSFSILGGISQPEPKEDHMQTRFSMTPCLVPDSCSNFNGEADHCIVIQSERSVDILTQAASVAVMQDIFAKRSLWHRDEWWGDVPPRLFNNKIVAFRLLEQTIYETGALGAGASIITPRTSCGFLYHGQLSTIGTQVAALGAEMRTDQDAACVKGAWVSNLFANVRTTLLDKAFNPAAMDGVHWPLVADFAHAQQLGNYGFPSRQIFALPLIVGTDGHWRFPEAGDMILSPKTGVAVWKLNRYLLTQSDQGLKILADQTYVNQKGKAVRCTTVPAFARGINVWPRCGANGCVIK